MKHNSAGDFDSRDVILRDKYREMVSEYSSEIANILRSFRTTDKPDSTRLLKSVRDLDSARQQLMTIEMRLSNETTTTLNQTAVQPIDFDAVRESVGRRLDRLRSAQGPRGIPG